MRINIGYFIKFIKKILGIKSHSKFEDFIYVEKDTICDLCNKMDKYKKYLIDCTVMADTRRHVINSIGHICPKDIKHTPWAISCNGDFMVDNKPCTSCDVYRKLKDKADEEKWVKNNVPLAI